MNYCKRSNINGKVWYWDLWHWFFIHSKDITAPRPNSPASIMDDQKKTMVSSSGPLELLTFETSKNNWIRGHSQTTWTARGRGQKYQKIVHVTGGGG